MKLVYNHDNQKVQLLFLLKNTPVSKPMPPETSKQTPRHSQQPVSGLKHCVFWPLLLLDSLSAFRGLGALETTKSATNGAALIVPHY